MVIHLDEIPSLTFPGGEQHPDIAGTALEHWSPGEELNIRAVVRSSAELMNLALVAEILRRKRLTDAWPAANLILPYVPYGRQDRATTPTTAHSLAAFCRILNDLEFQKVTVYEPHSEITPNLISNCVVVGFERAVGEYVSHLLRKEGCQKIVFVAPDAGAAKRTERALAYVRAQPDLQAVVNPHPVQAIKHRDPATGRLHIEYVSPIPAGADLVVVDDLCDGGATFLELAKHLNAGRSRHLFVAHGLFSKGTASLLDAYQTLGTTDSWTQRADAAAHSLSDRLHVFASI